MQRLPDGRVSIQSEDATVRLVVHPHGKRFAVCFPLLVNAHDTVAVHEEKSRGFTYFWQTQLFATSDYPSRWKHPLSLATTALQQPEIFWSSSPGHEEVSAACSTTPPGEDGKDSGNREGSSPVVDSHVRTDKPSQAAVPLSGKEASDASSTKALVPRATSQTSVAAPEEPEKLSVMQRTTNLPQAVVATSEGPNFVQDKTWWTECSLEQLPNDV